MFGGIGLMELIVVGMIGLLVLGVPIAILVLLVVLVRKSIAEKSERGGN